MNRHRLAATAGYTTITAAIYTAGYQTARRSPFGTRSAYRALFQLIESLGRSR